MRAYTHPPAKTGVTGVTRVTPIAKRPVSLAFTYVTQLRSLAFIRCNTARACNAKIRAWLLRAGVLAPLPTKRLSLVAPLNPGRGTLRYTVPITLRDD